jgi:LmbE family N-acetylglucosaminyl deacetylase
MEMGMGGTIAKHVDRGDDVHMLTCTLGGVHGDPADRMKEAQAGAQILGVPYGNIDFLDYPVTKLNEPSRELADVLKKSIRDKYPERVYVHSPHDYHQVHVAIGTTVLDLARSEGFLNQVLCYEVVSSTSRDFKPDAFVDITKYIDLKVESILAHKSQSSRIYTQPGVIRALCNIRYAREKLGMNPNGMAEGFAISKYVV